MLAAFVGFSFALGSASLTTIGIFRGNRTRLFFMVLALKLLKLGEMYAYLFSRLFGALFTLILISVLVFCALELIPGDPAQIMLGTNADPDTLQALRHQLGLDVPAWQRFGQWWQHLLRGDLGTSIQYDKAVLQLVRERLSISLPLALAAMLLACGIGFPLGISAALLQRSRWRWLDSVLVMLSQLGAAIPAFWLGLLLILLFNVRWQLLPATSFVPWSAATPWLTVKSMLLPLLALGLGQAAIISRMTRSAMLEILSQDYIRSAKAKGLRLTTIIGKHALRNALVSLITIIALSFSQLLIGTIIIEKVFNLPGMGTLLLNAVANRDFPLLQGQILLYASVIVVLNTLVDASYGVLDPRIRYS